MQHSRRNQRQKPGYYNAGVFMCSPSPSEHCRLLEALETHEHRGLAEQDLLNDICKTRALPQAYNAQKWISFLDPALWDSMDPVRIVHYNNAKPWALDDNGEVTKVVRAENENCPWLVQVGLLPLRTASRRGGVAARPICCILVKGVCFFDHELCAAAGMARCVWGQGTQREEASRC